MSGRDTDRDKRNIHSYIQTIQHALHSHVWWLGSWNAHAHTCSLWRLFSLFFYRAQNPWKIAQNATCKARLVHCTLWTCTRRHTGSSGVATSPIPLNVRPPKPVDLSKTYCTWHFFLVFTWDFCYSVVLLICISGFSVMIFMFQRATGRPTAKV